MFTNFNQISWSGVRNITIFVNDKGTTVFSHGSTSNLVNISANAIFIWSSTKRLPINETKKKTINTERDIIT